MPQPNTTNTLDKLDDRLMQKVQYRKVGAAESLWVVHTVRPPARARLALQWAQIDVTGGTIATTPVQQQIYAPDTTLYRWMGSLAVDNQGNMALGYSTSNGVAPEFPEHRLLRPARHRPAEHAAADRSAAHRRRGLADQQLRRRAVRPLGRLHAR